MKIRSNFVSNSSSSSFVVIVRENEFNDRSRKFLISDKEIKKLIKFGFKYMKGYSKALIIKPEQFVKSIDEFCKEESINLYKDCLCNQEDISDFLFKNKIPFIASIHNDDELWVYKGENYYEVIQNYMSQYLMNSGSEILEKAMIEEIKNSKPYRKVSLK